MKKTGKDIFASMIFLACMTAVAVAGEEAVRLKAPELVLARRGFPAEYSIALPAKPSDAQRYAAEELRDYVRKMTGVELPLGTSGDAAAEKAIVFDGKADADLGEDGFRLVADGQRVRIVGSPVRGCLYGVYGLLERFGGVRWFASWHEVVPARDGFTVPASLDIREKPAIPAREVFWRDPLGDPVFAARLRMNRRSWRTTDAKFGGHVLRFSSRLGTCHTFNALVPPAKYFASHPEYFSEIGGRRLREHTQLCLTNPDVLAIVISNVVADIDRNPSAEVFGVSQNDWYNNCTCAACKALDEREGSPAGSMIAFVNAVAEAVTRLRPGKRIETLAYQYTRRPPKTIAPRPDVMICLCSIECDFGRPIATGTYSENVKFRDDIRIWSERSRDLYIWDYTTDFNHFLLPFPNIPALQDNIRFFRDNKAYCVFEQGAYKGWHGEFAELKTWLLAKWLWDPELDRARLVDEFLAGYYGAAAPFVKTYLTELESGWKEHGGGKLGCFASVSDMSRVFTDGFLAHAQDLWQRAEDAVQNDPACRYNVRMGMLPVLYLRSQKERSRWNLTRHVIRPSEAVRRFLAYYDEAARAGRPVRICEGNKNDAARVENLRAAAAIDELAPTNRIRIAAGKLSRSGPAGACRDVDDAAAEGGRAVFLANDNHQWYTTFRLASVAFEPGVKYKLRVRLRADVTGKPGEVVLIGVYDHLTKKECGSLSLNAKRLKDGYAWYDVLTWVPDSRNQMVYIAPGRFDKKSMDVSPAHDGVWLDSIEIVR